MNDERAVAGCALPVGSTKTIWRTPLKVTTVSPTSGRPWSRWGTCTVLWLQIRSCLPLAAITMTSKKTARFMTSHRAGLRSFPTRRKVSVFSCSASWARFKWATAWCWLRQVSAKCQLWSTTTWTRRNGPKDCFKFYRGSVISPAWKYLKIYSKWFFWKCNKLWP